MPETTGTTRGRNRRLFALGLGVRVAGVALLWAGDGSSLWWRKALVVVGVVLSVGGITVLRYLLLAKPLSRLALGRRSPAAAHAARPTRKKVGARP